MILFSSISDNISLLKIKAVDSIYFPFDFLFDFLFFRTKVRVRVTRSYCYTSVTSDDTITGHMIHGRI